MKAEIVGQETHDPAGREAGATFECIQSVTWALGMLSDTVELR